MTETEILLKGDCLVLLDELEQESVDLVVVDSPYRLNFTTGSATGSAKSESWQGTLRAGDPSANIKQTSFDGWLPKVYRVLKQKTHLYSFVNDKNIVAFITAAQQAGFQLHNVLVWHKNNVTPNRWYMKNCEFVVFMRKGPAKPINELSSSQYHQVNNIPGKRKLHPTQKPVPLLERFILNSSKPGDVVLDPFMGSGSTGVACRNIGRRFIGIEIDTSFFTKAQTRINGIGEQNV